MTRFHCDNPKVVALANEHNLQFVSQGKPPPGQRHYVIYYANVVNRKGPAASAIFGANQPTTFRIVEEWGEPIVEVD